MFCKRAGHTALDILEGVVKIRLKIIRLLRVNWMNVVAKISSESFIETYIGKKLDFWMKKKNFNFHYPLLSSVHCHIRRYDMYRAWIWQTQLKYLWRWSNLATLQRTNIQTNIFSIITKEKYLVMACNKAATALVFNFFSLCMAWPLFFLQQITRLRFGIKNLISLLYFVN